MKALRTVDLARAAGVHPNTVRRYADRGLLPPVERSPNGYRRFTRNHLDCLRIARLIYKETFPGRAIRHSASRVLQNALRGDWVSALVNSRAHLAFVQSEQTQAETAALLLERWAAGMDTASVGQPMPIGQAARMLDVSIDMLRNWERNGLITVPRQTDNRYRRYGPTEISRLRVIRTLSRAGYSQMAILRMLRQLDRGVKADLRHVLNIPPPDEDVYSASDRWLSTLADQEQAALRLIALVEEIVTTRSVEPPYPV